MNAQASLSMDFQQPRAFQRRGVQSNQGNGLSIRFKGRLPLAAQANLSRELRHYVANYKQYVDLGYSVHSDNFKISASILSVANGF